MEKKAKFDFKNFIFDCDSTLVRIEGLDYLSSKKPLITDAVKKITTLGMEGKISLKKSLSKRLDLIKPSLSDLAELGVAYCDNLSLGVYDFLSLLKETDTNIYIVSSAPYVSLLTLADFLDLEKKNVFGLVIHFNKDGDYLGIDYSNPLSGSFGKVELVKSIARLGSTVLIGDGINDLEAAQECDLFIGYGGVVQRESVKENSDYYFSGDFTQLLDFLLSINLDVRR